MTSRSMRFVPQHLTDTANVLAVALSEGRRRRVHLMGGSDRAFTTDLNSVYVPWPLGPKADLRFVTCGLALQASPTKESVAGAPLARLTRRELHSLMWIEGEAALGWIARRWPGLMADFEPLLPGAAVGDPDVDGAGLLRMALARSRPAPEPPPELLGRLGGPGAADGSLLKSWRAKTRMRWSKTPVMKGMVGFSFGVAGDEGNGPSRSSSAPDDDDVNDEMPCWDEQVGLPYPEWDLYRERYRPDHVRVLERRIPVPLAAYAPLRPEIARWFAERPDRARALRLEDGTDVDVDAFIDHHVRARTGEVLDGRVYADIRPADRDVATAILLDTSASLQGPRSAVFQVELSCADALVTTLARGREPHAVFTFSGHSRRRVELGVLRGFSERRLVLPSLASLRPGGYTRLGAALRHVSRRLLEAPAHRRILLSLGDGLPGDEGYEGRYARADVAMAAREAEEEGILLFHVGVGQVTNDRLSEMFGPDRCLRLRHPRELAPALALVHQGLCNQ